MKNETIQMSYTAVSAQAEIGRNDAAASCEHAALAERM